MTTKRGEVRMVTYTGTHSTGKGIGSAGRMGSAMGREEQRRVLAVALLGQAWALHDWPSVAG